MPPLHAVRPSGLLCCGSDGLERTARQHQIYGSVNLLFQMLSDDSSFLLLLAYQRIRGFAFMRYINSRLTLTATTPSNADKQNSITVLYWLGGRVLTATLHCCSVFFVISAPWYKWLYLLTVSDLSCCNIFRLNAVFCQRCPTGGLLRAGKASLVSLPPSPSLFRHR